MDIGSAARLLIQQHGKEAEDRAAARANELLAAGDVDGHSTWLRILAASQQLRRGRIPGERVN